MSGQRSFGKLSDKSMTLQTKGIDNYVSKKNSLLNLLTKNEESDNDSPTLVKPVLHNNFPNPFNPETTISFSLPSESDVEVIVYNVKGQKVKTLANDVYDKGHHTVIWKGTDDFGKKTSSGVYFYQFKVNGKSKSVKKCLLLK